MPRFAAAVAALGLLLVVAGCGGGGHAQQTAPARSAPASEAAREEQARKHLPGKELAAADKVAYYQLATTSGLLRERAATVLTRHRGVPAATLRAARARLKRLEPASAALAALRDQLRTAVDRLLARPSRPRARAAYKASASVNAGLERWGRGRKVRALVPD